MKSTILTKKNIISIITNLTSHVTLHNKSMWMRMNVFRGGFETKKAAKYLNTIENDTPTPTHLIGKRKYYNNKAKKN